MQLDLGMTKSNLKLSGEKPGFYNLHVELFLDVVFII